MADAWRNSVLALPPPGNRTDRNSAQVNENQWVDQADWSRWRTQFLAPWPGDAPVIPGTVNRSSVKPKTRRSTTETATNADFAWRL